MINFGVEKLIPSSVYFCVEWLVVITTGAPTFNTSSVSRFPVLPRLPLSLSGTLWPLGKFTTRSILLQWYSFSCGNSWFNFCLFIRFLFLFVLTIVDKVPNLHLSFLFSNSVFHTLDCRYTSSASVILPLATLSHKDENCWSCWHLIFSIR